jgi:hypothetical protein
LTNGAGKAFPRRGEKLNHESLASWRWRIAIGGLSGCPRVDDHEKAGRVRIHLDFLGGEFTIDKQNSVDLLLAITQAFTATRAKLEEYVHKPGHDVKIAGRCPDVRVTTIFPPNGYGVFRGPRRTGNLFSLSFLNRCPHCLLEEPVRQVW